MDDDIPEMVLPSVPDLPLLVPVESPSQGFRRSPCPPAPWDENTWFDLPRITYVTLPLGATTIIAKPNPLRVALIIGANGFVAVSFDPAVALTGNVGLLLNQANNGPTFIEITQADYGPLAQMAWYAGGVINSNPVITVIEITLRDWPR